MIIFGWLVLLFVTLWAAFGTLILSYASLGLTGKLGFESLFFSAVSGLLIWATVANFPFVVVVAQ